MSKNIHVEIAKTTGLLVFLYFASTHLEITILTTIVLVMISIVTRAARFVDALSKYDENKMV